MKHLLFVDDEKDLFPLISRLFSKDHYRIICAVDGVEAIMKCRNEEFDLIISDFKMPKMDGFKFYQQLRELEESKNVKPAPILFVSAWADELRSKRTSWENCDFLSKPFQMYELTQKAQRLLGELTSDGKSEGKLMLEKGETLFEEGDMGQSMYYVVSGKLSTFKRTPSGKVIQVGFIYPGELVGEMSVIDNSARSLKVVAEEGTELIQIPAEKVLSILNNQPKWIKLMLENMSRRLRSALKQID